MAGKRRPQAVPDLAAEARDKGLSQVKSHPLFAPLYGKVTYNADKDGNRCPAHAWAVVTSTGYIHLNGRRRGDPQEWAWTVAHCLLHFGFEHVTERHLGGWSAASGIPERPAFGAAWNADACREANQFLAQLKIGRPPADWDDDSPGGDLLWTGPPPPGTSWNPAPDWPDLLATGLSRAVGAAVDVAGGAVASLTGSPGAKTDWRLALDWFVSAYPLLGALADAFTLVEDADVCRAHGIRVAAISPVSAELYVNPLSGPHGDGERRFIIAHELLHAGLRHDTRCGSRDPWLWNVACDFVINGWLAEMAVGDLPDGLLHDQSLRGLSAEEVYDRITADRRRYRKLATLRGAGLGDVLPGPLPGPEDRPGAVDLDEFYRRSLTDGIEYHRSRGRGLLPAGLVEEIRALSQPPVPWDVELAQWFDEHFALVERRRSYGRASRRQAATPDIPRPGWYLPPEAVEGRVFGVVLDTSGSMDTRLLGKALGAIASYAVAREVRSARVVFCDAVAYDNGWMPPLDIAGRVRVRGRGGTVLQPGIDLLESAPDFPEDGPVLVITDGQCDHVRVHREHAFLVPAGAVLPFRPPGPVFRLK